MRLPNEQELMHFLANHCVGQEYDSCVDSPCRHASREGCTHPKHPKILPPVLRSGTRVSIHTEMNKGRTGVIVEVNPLTGFHWVDPDDRDDYVIGPFSSTELEVL